MAIKNRAAMEKIVQARTSLLLTNGFFGVLAMQLRLVECTEAAGKIIDTMAVDGKTLWYNAGWTTKLTDPECVGVMAHEVMHCALKHMLRRGSRHPDIWNIACDHYINLDLTDSGFVLPKPNCCDPKFKGMTSEAIYDELMKDVKIIRGKLGDGSDPGNCGGILDAPGDSAEKTQLEADWESNVRMAVEVAKNNNVGNLPGSLKKLLDQMKKPKVSWRDKTKRFVDNSLSRDTSWARLSRRSWAIGCLLPGYTSDAMRKLIFIVDDSGSVSMEMAKQMLGEVAGALDQGTADEIVVLYADTKVHHVDRYYKGDQVTIGQYRGGGTDFRDSFNWVMNNEPDASCVIYLTDMGTCNFGEDPGCPVLWAVYCPEAHFEAVSKPAPFGECLHVDNLIG